jgi:hypothetical protein
MVPDQPPEESDNLPVVKEHPDSVPDAVQIAGSGVAPDPVKDAVPDPAPESGTPAPPLPAAGMTNLLARKDVRPTMQERFPGPGTNILAGGWTLKFAFASDQVELKLDETITIGRNVEETDDVMLDLSPYNGYESGVSRMHAKITFEKGFVYLTDTGSTNGTRINGFQLAFNQPYRLRDGDEVEFARLRCAISFIRHTS